MIPWLPDQPCFPPVSTALDDPSGLLAAGGKLTSDWLLAAYRRGIFPWYSEGQPLLWWSPDPRLVLYPGEVRVSRSLRRVLRKRPFEIRLDTAFDAVVTACAAPRSGASGTWITDEMQRAYSAMHQLGYAHSVEAWRDGELIGGLYGIALGNVFFGESMFSRVSDSSKVCFVHLARFLEARNFGMIDCQMTTAHLLSLGAREIPRAEFCAQLEQLVENASDSGRWPAAGAEGFFEG